ncbi:MAG: 50S ribosomal protein L22 [Dehalococcoidales bacterium]|nr:50S ribosomal protein L22 [Dehalococcoidales bacterium]
MEVRATARYTGIPARKVRLLLDMVRGKKVEEAVNMLKFMPSPNAKAVAKLVKSAAANAENNYQMTPADLKIVRIFANEAPFLKRFRPVSRGRAAGVLRRSSHITVVVSE